MTRSLLGSTALLASFFTASLAQAAGYGAGSADASVTQPGSVATTVTTTQYAPIAQYQPAAAGDPAAPYNTLAPAAGPVSTMPQSAPPAFSNSYTTSTSGMTSSPTPYAQSQTLDQQLQNRAASPYAATGMTAQPAPLATAPAATTPNPAWQQPMANASQGDSGMAQAEPSAPSPNAANDSLFITGGVTKDERDHLDSMAKNYNLQLRFSNTAGELVSDVQVNVVDSKGKPVFSTQTDGPVLMAKLDPGSYKIETSKAGETKTQTVQITKGGMKRLNVLYKNS